MQKAAKEQEPYNWSPKSARNGNKDQQKRLVPEETAFVDALQLPDSARIRIKGCRASDNQTCGAHIYTLEVKNGRVRPASSPSA